MPMVASGYEPLLICLGLLLACLSIAKARPIARHIPVWIEGRGPPIHSSLPSLVHASRI
jgi:hypothetical protein